MTTAATILEQLGGNKFLAMTGAKNLMSGDDTLYFSIPLSNDINKVSITLDVNDTYRVTFSKYRPRKLDVIIIHTQSDVYADQLRALFTDQTGLQTSL
jgi:hypothetical protein